MKYRKLKFNGKTLSGDTFSIYVKEIKNIYMNTIQMGVTYRYWVKTGNFTAPCYNLTPESLIELLSVLDEYQSKHKLNLISCRRYLEVFPNMTAIIEYEKHVDKLPVHPE